MRIFTVVLVILIIYVAYDIYYGRNGVIQYNQTVALVQKAQEKIKSLELRNSSLSDEIKDLKQGNVAVEEVARSELGLIKQNEEFFRIVDKRAKDDRKN